MPSLKNPAMMKNIIHDFLNSVIAEIYEYIRPLVEDEAKQINVQQSPSISPDAEKIKGRFGLRK